MIVVRRSNDHIEVKINHNHLVLTPEQAYILVRKIAKELGLRVTIGKPILTAKLEPGGYTVSIIEGSLGVRTFFIPNVVVEAYMSAVKRLGRGKFRYHEFVRAAFKEMVKLGVKEVEEYLRYSSESAWKMLFGSRSDYYQFFRVPVLLLQHMGVLNVTRRYIVVKG